MKTQFALGLLLAFVCLAKGDVPQAKYACSRHNVEAQILRLQPYLTAMEVEQTIKLVIAEQVYTKMATLGVPAADITKLRTDTTTKGTTVTTNMMSLMGKCQTLADHLGNTNHHVVNDQTKLSADLTQLNSLLADLDIYFPLHVDNAMMFVDFFTSSVRVKITATTGPEKAEIEVLLDEATAVMTRRTVQMNEAKVEADLAATVTRDALQGIITP